MEDVYAWVRDSLAAEAQSIKFELYTSPPRRVFASRPIETLADLGLTPAAIINLSWVDIDEASIPRPYFADNLLMKSDDKTSSSSSMTGVGQSSTAFPVAKQLVPAGESLVPADGLSRAAAGKGSSSSSGQSHASGAKTGKVPKWLKNS